MQGEGAFLVIEKGEPYEKGTSIQLPFKEILLGRSWGKKQADISFSSLYISKRHAIINFTKNQFTITDLISKHGTRINGYEIEQQQPYALNNGDQISLARGVAILTFNYFYDIDTGETVDFANCHQIDPVPTKSMLEINIERREILLDGKRLYLFGKDLELLLLLYQNKNKAVGYNEIRIKVWPERLLGSDIPDVGKDEINALVYRLRKRLGKYGHCITSIPRYGYMLDL